MNAIFQRPLLFVALLMAGSSLRAATPVIGAQLFQDTNVRIDDLFQYRNTPPKPPGPAENPFRPVDAPVANTTNTDNTTTTIGPEIRETADESMLRSAYSRLNFGGLIEVGSTPMVVINKVPYKEGGVLIVRVQGTDVYLRIMKLSKDTITLGLHDARVTLHF